MKTYFYIGFLKNRITNYTSIFSILYQYTLYSVFAIMNQSSNDINDNMNDEMYTISQIIVGYIAIDPLWNILDFNKAINVCKSWRDLLNLSKFTYDRYILDPNLSGIYKSEMEKLNLLIFAVEKEDINIPKSIDIIWSGKIINNIYLPETDIPKIFSELMQIFSNIETTIGKLVCMFTLFTFLKHHIRFCELLIKNKNFKKIVEYKILDVTSQIKSLFPEYEQLICPYLFTISRSIKFSRYIKQK